MARPIWKGHIAFGLVNIPISLHTAEKRKELELHMIDTRDHSRVKYERVNAESGEEVPWDQIARGYEFDDGKYIVLSDDDLKRAAPEVTRTIDIAEFVPLESISPVYFDKPYYLEPGKGGEKGYLLLRRALDETGLVGVTKVVLRTRQYSAVLLPLDHALVLNLLRYDDELRGTDALAIPMSLPKGQTISPQEAKIARLLVENMKGDWEPEKYHDEYRRALLRWINKRVKAGEITSAPVEEEEEVIEDAPAPINFLELLQQSVEQNTGKKTGRRQGQSGKATTRRKAG